ncbi:chitobiosyldiphosphodolichol beta-mannosyltransferase-like isoform X1 [Chlorella sorokiniana]|uniref:Chitobiosyldiphosphodolichol beta-mannosyltransferase-like isoform X1 n=1 Tax=Chlorella sorokiniana TaxID=3076 RepID=A0A2P6TRY7_CHLSO|nr:chitobiosyldiphosphodolichol beta-mannosyltransferase-like isoform X1 [Chlorella sorokiniana]|eukprot:PRW56830.1 chitobiosyldiphosphodolichol beta-mannosyltransferase-like isoform X1 [Chlorella sorokiniana]
MPRAWVMVLGDVGRSPRMQYHASSLCKTPGYEVTLIGYQGAALVEELKAPAGDGRLTLAYLPDLPAALRRLPHVLQLAAKALFQLLTMLWLLLVALPRPDVILLQLPPALPTMLVCRLAALRHRARLVFDWHNFAYTLMAIGMGRGHPVVRLAEKYERQWGRSADASLCVTRAMQRELAKGWRVPATVFYDRPPDFFRPASLEQTHTLLLKLAPALSQPLHPADFVAELYASGELAPGQTPCTVAERGGRVREREGRPALVVSSTSWTPDEDFGLLLKAAELYDGRVRRSRHPGRYPRILFLVTGRGPQRQAYEERMRGLDLRYVAFRTLWLEPEDYPRLLGSADLGVSLHASSSGLDLPMKVVDMFGCGLPVCALTYSCIGELVSHEHNGLLFATPEQLAQQLLDVFRGFAGRGEEEANGGTKVAASGGSAGTRRRSGAAAGTPASATKAASGDCQSSTLLAQLRRGVAGSSMARWHDTWQKIVLPVLEGAPSGAA